MRISRQVRIFVAFNIALAFWHIFKYSLVLQVQHQNQQLTKEHKKLLAQKQELCKTWCSLRSPQAIHEFARQQ